MKKLIYDNPLKCQSDIKDFIMEGSAKVSFENARMKLSSALDPELGQAANYVFWCNETFPANVEITWEFTPLNERGLCILFFAAAGKNGEDLFSTNLATRNGMYGCYHSGDINAYHISYFRRSYPEERAFRTCNLRKSYGFELAAIAGDPLPNVADAQSPYRMCIRKNKNVIDFFINEMPVLHFEDKNTVWQEGKIGFRQMSPMVAEYANFKIHEIISDL